MQPDDVVAIDLGGTRMRAALVSSDGSILARRSCPTPTSHDGLDSLFELAKEVAVRGVSRAVVAVPGRVDYQRGRLEHAPNLPERWTWMLRADHLADRLGLDVTLANDADSAAVGEAYFGAGRGYKDVAYMTVSTGIGAGVLLGGRLMHGRRSSAEIGHTIIDREALRSGAPATLEDLGSGSALEASATAADLPADARAVGDLARDGDSDARRMWRELIDAVVMGVTNLAHLFTPEVIVLGGGIGRNADGLLPSVRKHLADHGPHALPHPIVVAVAELGDDAGLVGAAVWHRATGGAPQDRSDRRVTQGPARRRELA